MIIENPDDLIRAVLAEAARTPDPRLHRILESVVQRLHGFVRDSELTEAELRQICGLIAKAGQLTTPSHNEVVAAGSLGVSALVCLMNNGDGGRVETIANLMGPFWRTGSPVTPNGGSIVRSPTRGDPVFVHARVRDEAGRPVLDAEVDVWQASGGGYYENQDPQPADMNLRDKVHHRRRGPHPLPHGQESRGFKMQFSQLYSSDDPHLENDVPFGDTHALVGRYVLHDGDAPDADVQGRWYSLEHDFVISALTT